MMTGNPVEHAGEGLEAPKPQGNPQKKGFDPRPHLIRVQGNREYLPVAARLIWFREAHPNWGIKSEMIHCDWEAKRAVFKAVIEDETGRVIAEAFKHEDVKGFPDWLEKANTGAVGRALALCGFGTQFAPELEEGERLADTPQSQPQGAPPQATPQGAAPAAGGHPVCSNSDCGRVITQGQYQVSVQKHGRALCPACQKTVGGGS